MVNPAVSIEEPEPDLDDPNIPRPPTHHHHKQIQQGHIATRNTPDLTLENSASRSGSETLESTGTIASKDFATQTNTNKVDKDGIDKSRPLQDEKQSQQQSLGDDLAPLSGYLPEAQTTLNRRGSYAASIGSQRSHQSQPHRNDDDNNNDKDDEDDQYPNDPLIEPTWGQSFKNTIKAVPVLCFVPIILPIAWSLHFTHQSPVAVFITTLIGIVPLAGGLGFATEELALRVGEAWGGLLNASFGNAVELLIAILALVKGEIAIVQASMVGSILSNILLVLGMSYFAGGLRFHEQMYFTTAAQMQISLLGITLMAIALPAAYHYAYPSTRDIVQSTRYGTDIQGEELENLLKMSRGLSFILLAVYGMFLCFQLWTHAYLFRIPREPITHPLPGPTPSHTKVFPKPDWVPSLADSSSSEGSVSSGRSGHTHRSPFRRLRGWSTTRRSEGTDTQAHEADDQDNEVDRNVDIERDAVDSYPITSGEVHSGGQHTRSPTEVHFNQNLPAASRVNSPSREKLEGEYQNAEIRPPHSAADERRYIGAPDTEEEKDLAEILAQPGMITPGGTITAPNGFVRTAAGLRPRIPQRLATARLPRMPRPPAMEEFEKAPRPPRPQPKVKWYFAFGMLFTMTALAGVSAEFLVDSIDGLVATGNVSREFVGLILLPVIGNSVEHVTAVTVSVKDKLNLSMSIAVGSSIQISLCILPILVLIGWAIGQPLTLFFDTFETISLVISVLLVNFAISDGRTNYLEGFVMMMAYLSIALVCWFYDPAV